MRTITFFFAMRFDAIVSAIVKAKGKPSGMAETAKAITVTKISLYGTCLTIRRIAISAATDKTRMLICFESFSTRIVSGDFSSSVFARLSAILPSSVSRAIPVTIAWARPDTTVVPENTIFDWSFMATFSFWTTSGVFATWTLSPVKIDSSTVKFCVSIRRISAVILSPDSRATTSPIVKFSASMS